MHDGENSRDAQRAGHAEGIVRGVGWGVRALGVERLVTTSGGGALENKGQGMKINREGRG